MLNTGGVNKKRSRKKKQDVFKERWGVEEREMGVNYVKLRDRRLNSTHTCERSPEAQWQ